MEYRTISASPRTEIGKGPVGRLRRDGKIPAVIYDRKGQTTLISLDAKNFGKEIHGATESTILKVMVGSKAHDAILKETQRDILRGGFVHVDFYEVAKDQVVRTHVPIHLVGNPEGVRNGGILEHATHSIEVECLPADLPEKIEVDVSGLQINHAMHVRDLKLDAKVRIVSSTDTIIATITHAKEEEAPAAAEAASTAATAAAPAAEAAPEKK